MTSLDRGHFWDLLRRPMQFATAMAGLEAEGNWLYVDCGPGSALASIAKSNLGEGSRSRCQPVDSPFGAMKNWGKLVEEMRTRE